MHSYFTEKKAEISELASEYIGNVKNMPSEERVQHLKKIENAYSKCKEYSDDKVQLAMQIYEMVRCRVLRFIFACPTSCIKQKQVCLYFHQVDKHIRRLDADLARFENDLQEKLDSGSPDSSDEKLSRSKSYCSEYMYVYVHIIDTINAHLIHFAVI